MYLWYCGVRSLSGRCLVNKAQMTCSLEDFLGLG